MATKLHALYLSIICVLLISLILSPGLRPFSVAEQEPIPRVVILPFRAMNSSPIAASSRLTDGLLQEFSTTVTGVTVIPPSRLHPSIGEDTGFPDWLKDQEESLVLLGTVTGPEEKLTVSIRVFDTRSRSTDPIWGETLITNIYDLDYVSAEIAGYVLSVANRQLPN